MNIIEKCGDIVYNQDYDRNLMQSCIYNKVKKSAIGYIFSKKIDIDFKKLENTKLVSKDGSKETEEELDLEQWNLVESQKDILHTISMYIEMGYDNKEAFNETAKLLQIDIEDLMYEVEMIKENILISKNKSDRENEEVR